ncbi:MAG TPA: hypothetical protein VGR37_15480 [Longimicrobiaceae bacterium]|nr:hypothetical protein [Longimicrobiaceae bacterium]
MRTAAAALLALVLALAPTVSPLGAQEAPPSLLQPAPDTLELRAQDAGARAARRTPAAGWFWTGFLAGLPAGPGALAAVEGAHDNGLAAATVLGAGASFGVAAAAANSRVRLSSEQRALLADADSTYAESYRRAYTDAVRSKRMNRALVGSAAGAATGAAALYALLCLAFCGAYT